jgi:hypothetical protein
MTVKGKGIIINKLSYISLAEAARHYDIPYQRLCVAVAQKGLKPLKITLIKGVLRITYCDGVSDNIIKRFDMKKSKVTKKTVKSKATVKKARLARIKKMQRNHDKKVTLEKAGTEKQSISNKSKPKRNIANAVGVALGQGNGDIVACQQRRMIEDMSDKRNLDELSGNGWYDNL